MRSIEHRAPSAPPDNPPRKGHPARYRFIRLRRGGIVGVSRVGGLAQELPRGGGR
jgi:hypothetical protein